MSLRNLSDKLDRYFWFSREETLALIITIVGLSFITSWGQWGTDTFSAYLGLFNFFKAFIFITITLLVHHSAQRITALIYGFKPEHKLWWNGLFIGLILAILSKGFIQFLGASALLLYMMPAHRIGKFRYGPTFTHIARINLMGPVANILLAGFIKSIEWIGIIPSTISQEFFVLNLWFAATNLLPVPPLDGSKILFKSRLTYVLVASTVLAYVALLSLFEIYSYILAIVIGLTCTVVYYLTIETK